MVKNLPTMQETWIRSLSREDPMEKEMDTLSSIFIWRIPWTREPGRPARFVIACPGDGDSNRDLSGLMDRGSAAAAAAKSLQLCPTLCDPIDGSPTGSPIPGILQARTLEWVAISFSNA